MLFELFEFSDLQINLSLSFAALANMACLKSSLAVLEEACMHACLDLQVRFTGNAAVPLYMVLITRF